jgi:hypothetical protein
MSTASNEAIGAARSSSGGSFVSGAPPKGAVVTVCSGSTSVACVPKRRHRRTPKHVSRLDPTVRVWKQERRGKKEISSQLRNFESVQAVGKNRAMSRCSDRSRRSGQAPAWGVADRAPRSGSRMESGAAERLRRMTRKGCIAACAPGGATGQSQSREGALGSTRCRATRSSLSDRKPFWVKQHLEAARRPRGSLRA